MYLRNKLYTNRTITTSSPHQFSKDCGKNRMVSVGPGYKETKTTTGITKEINQTSILPTDSIKEITTNKPLDLGTPGFNDIDNINKQYNETIAKLVVPKVQTLEDTAEAIEKLSFMLCLKYHGPIVKSINFDIVLCAGHEYYCPIKDIHQDGTISFGRGLGKPCRLPVSQGMSKTITGIDRDKLKAAIVAKAGNKAEEILKSIKYK